MNEIEKRQFEADLAKQGRELGEHVRLTRVIRAPAADIWKVISKRGHLPKYHAYVRLQMARRGLQGRPHLPQRPLCGTRLHVLEGGGRLRYANWSSPEKGVVDLLGHTLPRGSPK